MPYSKMFQKIVNNTNYTHAEIAEKCKKLGVDVDRTYINKLFNGKSNPPKEEISRAIAKACNADERLLVLEGYMDKAPKEVLETLRHMQFLTKISSLNIYENLPDITKEQFKEQVEQYKIELEKETIADYMIEILDTRDIDISLDASSVSFSQGEDNYNINFSTPIALPIQDNAMYPLIPQNSQIHLSLKSVYNNSEIIAFKMKGKEELYVRYLFYNDTDNKIMLTALNTEFKPIICKKEDILILGKVSKVIHDIL